MLQRLANDIAECLERADAAERRAVGTADPALKSDYEKIARGWRGLATSYQFAERLQRFNVELAMQRHALVVRVGANNGEPALSCPRCGTAMVLKYTTSRVGALPELRTYLCGGCAEVFTLTDRHEFRR